MQVFEDKNEKNLDFFALGIEKAMVFGTNAEKRTLAKPDDRAAVSVNFQALCVL